LCDYLRVHVARVHGDARAAWALVMSHAAADLAAPELARPPLLRVLHQRALPLHQARTTARAVRPQRAVAPADRAVALRELTRPARDLEHDGTAVTGRVQHRLSLRPCQRG